MKFVSFVVEKMKWLFGVALLLVGCGAFYKRGKEKAEGLAAHEKVREQTARREAETTRIVKEAEGIRDANEKLTREYEEEKNKINAQGTGAKTAVESIQKMQEFF